MTTPNQERCCECPEPNNYPWPNPVCSKCGLPPTQNHSTKEIPCVCGHWESRHYPECDVGPDGCMKYQPDHSTMEGWEEEFDENYNWWVDISTSNGEYLKDFIRTLLAKERESAERRGQMNPKVGFLRQYLNECGAFEKLWTDEDILGFIRLAFDEPKNYPEAHKDTLQDPIT